MANFRFQLEKYSGIKSRYRCPSCKTRNSFARYIDIEHNKHLSTYVGRCNRESKCSYHYTPKQYFKNRCIRPEITSPGSSTAHTEKPVSYISKYWQEKSLRYYSQNNFVQFLLSLFDEEKVASLINNYQIGTSKKWKGATIFWQSDVNNRIRTGKIILYDPVIGKRIRKPYDHIGWIHKELKLTGYNLQQCLFGEHLLLKHKNKTVAIAEGEKTALICSMFFPEYLWLATGGICNLNLSKLKPLIERKVILFPDLDAYDSWSKKADELLEHMDISVSRHHFFISSVNKRILGDDLADYLIRGRV